jgi:integrase
MQLSHTTKIQRDNIFTRVIKENGHLPFKGITRKNIASGRDKRAETPFAANNFLKAMRGLFGWATDAGHLEEDPTLGVKALRTKTDGFHEWTEEEVVAFEARWPLGTRERLALAILLYAGLRRGDAYTLGRQHVRNGVIYVRTEKKGVPVSLPIHPELQKAIDATATGSMAFIAKENGQPLNKVSFGNWFRKACQAAGVPGSAHGLRKAAAIRWAHAGATESQLMAWFGWTDPKMASLYTKRANRESLARNMFETLNANSIPSPKTQSPSPEAKQLKNKG